MIANRLIFNLPKIYPITDVGVSGLSHADQVARLIDGGARFIQLRDKVSAPKDFLREAEAALTLARRNAVQVIINDRVDIALAAGANGVHVGQSDLPAQIARQILGGDVIIGVSTHNLEQVKIAATLPVDYVAFGPIFETGTKQDHEPIAGLEGLRSARTILGKIPLVAIGGITEATAPDVFAAGADSIALIAALLSNRAKIAANMRRMLEIPSE
ncbi:MAG TPA: thiamine phosphate synthase [Pyrinomonadaceae bacterium]|nr:thiamine phosphate synthase [Pyrinomonadaceae bacterium]